MTKLLGPISMMIEEAKNYRNLENVEKLVQSGQDLAPLPVQPLYMALKAFTPEQVGGHLAQFSEEQRKVFLDLDLWYRDEVDVESFPFWIKSYRA